MTDFNNLVPVTETQFNGKLQQTVSAKALHSYLKIGNDFSTWIKGRIKEYDLIKGDDFLIFDSLEFRNQSANNKQITEWTTNQAITKLHDQINRQRGLKMTTSLYNNTAIQMYAQPLNNRPVNLCDVIFRHVREDFIDITTRARMCRETHCIGLNLKSWFCMSIKRESRILITWFCQSIKRKPRKQIPLFGGIKLMHYFLFGLFNFSRQAPITQAEKLVFSFLDCSSIFSISSCGKRISLRFDLLVSFAILDIHKLLVRTIYTKVKNKNSVDMCGQNKIYCTDILNFNILIKTIAQRVRTSMSYLTTNIKRSNAMANSNDTLCPKNGQYDLPNLLSVLNLYRADIQPQNLLHAKAHLEELRQSILWGIGAIGNLLFWASECEEYEEQQFKDDIRDIGYLLAQLKNVACFASNQINLLDDKLNHKEVNYNE